MLKGDVWCSMWFCILAMCLVYSAMLWYVCKRKGLTRVRLSCRHQRMKKAAQSINCTESEKERRWWRRKEIIKRQWSEELEKKRERQREKAVSNCPWHKSSNWCQTVKNILQREIPSTRTHKHTHKHAHTHTHKLGYREIQKNKQTCIVGTNGEQGQPATAEDYSMIKHSKEIHDNNCVCICVCTRHSMHIWIFSQR